MALQFKEWLLENNDENHYFWASGFDLADGTIITAGDWVADTSQADNAKDDYLTWPLWKAQERAFEKTRNEKYPHLPSRIGALFLTNNLKDGNMWKILHMHKHLYEVEIISGEPHKTDADIWSDAHGYIGGKWAYSSKADKNGAEKIAQDIDNGIHNLDDYATNYWKPSQIMNMEFILGKGGQVRIIKKII